ncbi:MAG: hypothetical protein AAF206_13895 [Bacteroidota bacterium]
MKSITYIRLIQAGAPDEYHTLDSFLNNIRQQVENEQSFSSLMGDINLQGSGRSELFSYRIEHLTEDEVAKIQRGERHG